MGSRYYYCRPGPIHGPFSGRELRRLAATGQIGPRDLIARDGISRFVPASQVGGLEFSNAAPAPMTFGLRPDDISLAPPKVLIEHTAKPLKLGKQLASIIILLGGVMVALGAHGDSQPMIWAGCLVGLAGIFGLAVINTLIWWEHG
jgi:hypothetical protein